jgi:hypothetical protein
VSTWTRRKEQGSEAKLSLRKSWMDFILLFKQTVATNASDGYHPPEGLQRSRYIRGFNIPWFLSRLKATVFSRPRYPDILEIMSSLTRISDCIGDQTTVKHPINEPPIRELARLAKVFSSDGLAAGQLGSGKRRIPPSEGLVGRRNTYPLIGCLGCILENHRPGIALHWRSNLNKQKQIPTVRKCTFIRRCGLACGFVPLFAPRCFLRWREFPVGEIIYVRLQNRESLLVGIWINLYIAWYQKWDD